MPVCRGAEQVYFLLVMMHFLHTLTAMGILP